MTTRSTCSGVAAAEVGGAVTALRGERQLVHAAAQGDRQAWNAIVDTHLDEVWAIPVGRGLPAPVAAEVCAIVWLRLAQQLGGIDEAVGDWLCRVATEESARAGTAAPLVTAGRARPSGAPTGAGLPRA